MPFSFVGAALASNLAGAGSTFIGTGEAASFLNFSGRFSALVDFELFFLEDFDDFEAWLRLEPVEASDPLRHDSWLLFTSSLVNAWEELLTVDCIVGLITDLESPC